MNKNSQLRGNLLNKSVSSGSVYSSSTKKNDISLMPIKNSSHYSGNMNHTSKNQIDQAILLALKDKSYPDLKRKNIIDIVAQLTSKTKPIAPENTWLLIWHSVIMFLILYHIFVIGLLLGYGEPVWYDILNYLFAFQIICLLCLIIDCFVSPVKAFYSKGLLITNNRLMVKRYFKIRIWVDIIAIISLSIPFISGVFALNWLKILFLPKIFTVYQIDKQFIRVTQLNIRLHTFYLLSRLVLLLILGSHYIGIFFYMIDLWVYQNNYYGPNTPNLCWIYNASSFSQIILILPWYGQYQYTMYFSIGTMTTIAYGDITPLNPLETTYTIFALLLYTICFAYILSEILRILMQAQAYKFQHTNNLLLVSNMMKDRMITEKTNIQVRRYFQRMWKEEVYRNRQIQAELISQLPQKIRNQLNNQLYQTMLIESKIYFPGGNNNIGTQFMVNIANAIKEERVVQGHYLFYENQKYQSDNINSHCLFYIKNVKNVQKTKNSIEIGVSKQSIILLSQGTVGLQSFYTGKPREHWAKILKGILVYRLPRQTLMKNLDLARQQERQNILMIVDSLNYEKFCYDCYICGAKKSHNFKQCPFVTYQPDIAQISAQRFNRRNAGYGSILSDLDKPRKKSRAHLTRTLQIFIKIRNNPYKIKNKYQMMISNPYYQKLLSSPSKTAIMKSRMNRSLSPERQSINRDSSSFNLESNIKKQWTQINIKKIESEDQQEYDESMGHNSLMLSNNVGINNAQFSNSQFSGFNNSVSYQSFIQNQDDSDFTSSDDGTSSQSSQDLQNYMKQTHLFIRHLQIQQYQNPTAIKVPNNQEQDDDILNESIKYNDEKIEQQDRIKKQQMPAKPVQYNNYIFSSFGNQQFCDVVKEYKIYHPQYNISNIIENYNQQLKISNKRRHIKLNILEKKDKEQNE